MKLQAKQRLLADEGPAQRKSKRETIQKNIDNSQKKIDTLKKSLPSRNNHMKVSQENQVNKRQQILQEEMKKQNLRKQKLRYRED